MFLMCTLIALTRVRSIIHKLIHKEKQYLRDLDTIETVRTYSCKVLLPRRLSWYIALHPAIAYREPASDPTKRD